MQPELLVLMYATYTQPKYLIFGPKLIPQMYTDNKF